MYNLGDNVAENWNPTAAPRWDDADRRHLSLWLRYTGSPSNGLFVIVAVETVDGSQNPHERFMHFRSTDGSPYISTHPNYPLGEALEDGDWHYLELELQAWLEALYADETITAVNGMQIQALDIYVDDIVLGGGRLRRSRQVVPGAALGGVLGSWTGPNVVAENGVTARYFQYNDLGTVLAQTKADGSLEGAWEPDHFGNYEGRYTYPGSPARPELGLTGKIFDPAAGLYYSDARWYDAERGRWVSKEPYGLDGPNLYGFVKNDPLNGYDHTGLMGVGGAVMRRGAGCLGPVGVFLVVVAYLGAEGYDAYCSWWTLKVLDLNASGNDPGQAGFYWGIDTMTSLTIKPGAPPLCKVVLLRARKAVDANNYHLANSYLESLLSH
jgi:RHS repeat-associated protein